MSSYYEMYVKDNRAGKPIRRILLTISLFILLFALIFLIFAIIATYWLLIGFAVLAILSGILANIAHLLTRDYMYIVSDNEIIIKRLYAEKYYETAKINIDKIKEIKDGILSDTIKYTPNNCGVTIITDTKNYSISPDDYMLALITQQRRRYDLS